jgi:hypothetical protein
MYHLSVPGKVSPLQQSHLFKSTISSSPQTILYDSLCPLPGLTKARNTKSSAW